MLTVKLLFLSFSVLDTHFLKSVIISFVVIEFLLIKMNDLVACDVQELTCVRYNDDSVLAVCDVILEPHDSVQV